MEPVTLTPTGQPPQASSNSYTATDGTKLNPTAVLLAQSIRQVESQNNYDAVGDGGESHGAYQFNKNNFQDWAKQYKLDPNDFSPVNQDRLAYTRINDLLGKGLKPSEVAAIWNGAKSTSTGYQAVNPQYVEHVKAEYTKKFDQYSGGQQASTELAPGVPSLQISSNQAPTGQQPQTIGQQLSSRGQDISQGANEAVQGSSEVLSGKPSGLLKVGSGALQVGGAIAGGAGDIVNKALENVPGYKQLENVIGMGAGALANSPVGKPVVDAMQQFSKANPELSKDIGAGFNIATAIPILKGLGVAKDVAMDGVSQALKSTAEKGFVEDTAKVITKAGKTGSQFLTDNPSVLRDMVDRRIIPDVAEGKFTTQAAKQGTWSTIRNANAQVGKLLTKPEFAKFAENSTPVLEKAVGEFPNSYFTPQDMINNGRELTPQNMKLWDKFEANQATMADINKLRSDLDGSVKSVYTSMNQPPIKTNMGASLAGAMRDFVKTSVPESVPLFDEMTTQFNIQKALKFIEGKSPSAGIMSQVGKVAATAGGEALGASTGIPFAGAYGGYKGASIASKYFPKGMLQRSVLERTGANAVTTPATAALKGGAGLIGGALANKANAGR